MSRCRGRHHSQHGNVIGSIQINVMFLAVHLDLRIKKNLIFFSSTVNLFLICTVD